MDITFFHSKRFGNVDGFSGQVQSLVVAAEYLDVTPVVVVVVGLASSPTGFLRLMSVLLPPSRQCSPHSTNHEATTTPTTIQIALDFFCTPVKCGEIRKRHVP